MVGNRYLTFVSHFSHVSMQTTLMNWLDLKSPSQALEFILRISLQCGWKSRHLKSLKIHINLFLVNLNIDYIDLFYPYWGSCGGFSSAVVFSQQNNSSPNLLSQLQTVGGFSVPKRNFFLLINHQNTKIKKFLVYVHFILVTSFFRFFCHFSCVIFCTMFSVYLTIFLSFTRQDGQDEKI